MQPQVYQLRDIHGLDPIPWWPPAPGWWLLAAGIILGLWLAYRLFPHLRPRALVGLTWRWDAARHLRELRRRVPRQEAKQSAAELSELLRRIAMARCGRDACAGLTGKDWLQWLSDNDPRQFDWSTQASIMLNLPYAPPGSSDTEKKHILALIDAAHNWLAREDGKHGPVGEVNSHV